MPAHAAEAESTAAATSAVDASRTSFWTVPSAGLNTGEVRVDCPAQAAPSTQWSRIVVADGVVRSRVVVSVMVLPFLFDEPPS